MSITATPAAVRAPKRQRGHLRVAAILEAAGELFQEKGYDAATMTEIAARSKTAIGSLYRFFPSKELLAEALMEEYAARLLEEMDAVIARTERLSSRQLAESLVAYRLALKDRRRAALALLESASGIAGKRDRLRREILPRMVRIIAQARPDLTPARAEAMAPVVLHLLKAVSEYDGASVAADVTDLLTVYFSREG